MKDPDMSSEQARRQSQSADSWGPQPVTAKDPCRDLPADRAGTGAWYAVNETGWQKIAENRIIRALRGLPEEMILITPVRDAKGADAGKVSANAAELVQILLSSAEAENKLLCMAAFPPCRLERKYWKYIPVYGELRLLCPDLVSHGTCHAECRTCILQNDCGHSKSPFELSGLHPLNIPAEGRTAACCRIRWVRSEEESLFRTGLYVHCAMDHAGLHFINSLYQRTVTLPLSGTEQACFAAMLHCGMTDDEIRELLMDFGQSEELFVSLLQGCIVE